jgi:hypothetical protein
MPIFMSHLPPIYEALLLDGKSAARREEAA